MSDNGRRRMNISDEDLKMNQSQTKSRGNNQKNDDEDSGGNDFYANLIQKVPGPAEEDANGDTETTNSDYEKSLIIKKKRQLSPFDNSSGIHQSLKPALKQQSHKQTINNLRHIQSQSKHNQQEQRDYRGNSSLQKPKLNSHDDPSQRMRVSSSENSNTKYETKLLKAPPSEYVVLSSEQKGSGYVSKRETKFDFWATLMTWVSYFLLIITMPFSLFTCIKISQEFERAVIFRLGRVLEGDEKGPGIFFVLPCIDSYTKVDLRTVTFDVPPQEILTKDSVTVSVDAVVYFRIFSAVVSVINVEDAAKSTKLLAASTLRNILGTKSLHEILADRESIAISIQSSLDDATEPWGVKVERVEVKDVRLPVQLQRAMAAEAEATREARAKVIAAEGENKASKALKSAAEVISQSPIAIQLRYLQTLTQIASERNSTIVFPVPLEMLSFLRNNQATDLKQNF